MFTCSEWCTILCVEDNKTTLVNAKSLETESSDYVTEVDLQQSKGLVWRHKGVPYTVEVKEIHGKLIVDCSASNNARIYFILGLKKPTVELRRNRRRYLEDSDSSDSEVGRSAEVQPPTKKKASKSQGVTVEVSDTENLDEVSTWIEIS